MPTSSIDNQPFGTLADGTAVDRYRLTGGGGIEAEIIPFGGIVTALLGAGPRWGGRQCCVGVAQA